MVGLSDAQPGSFSSSKCEEDEETAMFRLPWLTHCLWLSHSKSVSMGFSQLEKHWSLGGFTCRIPGAHIVSNKSC